MVNNLSKYSIEAANNIAAGFVECISKKSIQYHGDAEHWTIDFNLLVPKRRFEGSDSLETLYTMKDKLNADKNTMPGSSYLSVNVWKVIHANDRYWLVKIYAQGGYNI